MKRDASTERTSRRVVVVEQMKNRVGAAKRKTSEEVVSTKGPEPVGIGDKREHAKGLAARPIRECWCRNEQGSWAHQRNWLSHPSVADKTKICRGGDQVHLSTENQSLCNNKGEWTLELHELMNTEHQSV